MFSFSLIAKIVIAVVAAAFSYSMSKSSSTKQAPASFEDFDFPQFDEGTPIAYVFGDVWLDDWMVLGLGNYRAVQKEVKV